MTNALPMSPVPGWICLAECHRAAISTGDRFPVRMESPESPTPEIDESVLRAIAGRDADAFSSLYQAFSRPLFSLAFRMLQRREDAEELLQEVFVKIWNDAAAYNGAKGTAFTWAATITRNKAIDRIRSSQRRSRLHQGAEAESSVLSPSQPAPVRIVEAHETASTVQGALKSLPADQRIAMELAYFEGLSQSEIAERLQEPITTIKGRIRRAMMTLRKELQPAE